nr:hypothetical protein [Tanacetum cinerariifolium]
MDPGFIFPFSCYISPKANTLLRFEALTEVQANFVYAHESCKDMKVYYKECKKELGQQDRVEELEKEKSKTKKSAEYKRSLGEAIYLAIGKGFIDGISIGHENPDIQAILKATPNVDPASSDTFMKTYEKLFDKRYPYVDKVARAYLLDPTGLQNVMPDETGPTPGERPRDTPTTSNA